MKWRLGIIGLIALAMSAVPVSQADPPRVPVIKVRTPQSHPGMPAGDGAAHPLTPVVVAGGFRDPVEAVVPPGDDRLFVVEKPGVVRIVHGDGTVDHRPYLDLRDIVKSEGVEQGLLGLAFHPDFAANGRVFVHYTDLDGHVQVVEFADNRDPADPVVRSVRRLLSARQPQQFHNGGTLRFDPEGYLMVGLGDGGGIGDQYENGQDPDTMLGAILRLDIDGAQPYAVPSTNPFASGGGTPEIWVYGLRNPWRFFVDPVERLVVIGDVGQFSIEEITVLSLDSSGGSNLGWPIVEGDTCFLEETCDPTVFVSPQLTYLHQAGCAVQGGPIYRGDAVPWLRGMVVYGDFCGGWVRAFPLEGDRAGEWVSLAKHSTFDGIYSLAVDGAGEILVLATDGTIYRLEE